METAIMVALVSFGAVVAVVVLAAMVLGLRSYIDTRRRRKDRAKSDAEAWTALLSSQVDILPATAGKEEAKSAVDRAKRLLAEAQRVLSTAKKTSQFEKARAYALAGLKYLNQARTILGKTPGPAGSMPFNARKRSERHETADQDDVPTGPATGIHFS
ncbi:hypothetical protein [Haloglycomyces albus]|uniref:hypothetical protein n=1 Tax=Haloglycomyces albus TaxID=526067 RepID=UPI00046D291C|nr:hypothetical protein [Haloglycomyces albus]